MFVYLLYIISLLGLGFSFFKDKKKTKKALKKSWKSFENILPQFLSLILIIGITLSIIDTENITRLIGSNSGIIGIMIAAIVGSITLIPGFIAFPLAATLFENGAGVVQISIFISTLMMVGIITLPMEIKTFGKKSSFIRNILAFSYSIGLGFLMGAIL